MLLCYVELIEEIKKILSGNFVYLMFCISALFTFSHRARSLFFTFTKDVEVVDEVEVEERKTETLNVKCEMFLHLTCQSIGEFFCYILNEKFQKQRVFQYV